MVVLVVVVEEWEVGVVLEEGGVYHADLVDSVCRRDSSKFIPNSSIIHTLGPPQVRDRLLNIWLHYSIQVIMAYNKDS